MALKNYDLSRKEKRLILLGEKSFRLKQSLSALLRGLPSQVVEAETAQPVAPEVIYGFIKKTRRKVQVLHAARPDLLSEEEAVFLSYQYEIAGFESSTENLQHIYDDPERDSGLRESLFAYEMMATFDIADRFSISCGNAGMTEEQIKLAQYILEPYVFVADRTSEEDDILEALAGASLERALAQCHLSWLSTLRGPVGFACSGRYSNGRNGRSIRRHYPSLQGLQFPSCAPACHLSRP